MMEKEKEVKDKILNISGVENVRVSERDGIENDLGIIEKDVVAFAVKLDEETVEKILNEKEENKEFLSNTHQGIINQINELGLTIGDYRFVEDDNPGGDLKVGEFYAILEQQR